MTRNSTPTPTAFLGTAPQAKHPLSHLTISVGLIYTFPSPEAQNLSHFSIPTVKSVHHTISESSQPRFKAPKQPPLTIRHPSIENQTYTPLNASEEQQQSVQPPDTATPEHKTPSQTPLIDDLSRFPEE